MDGHTGEGFAATSGLQAGIARAVSGSAQNSYPIGKMACSSSGFDVQHLESRCILKVLAVFISLAAPMEFWTL
jgi:hypothetical protein